MVTIKSLSKEQQAEGLTLDLVNSKSFLKCYSPVMLLPGDEPTKLLECAAGYWVMLDDDTFLKDGNKLFVVPVKDAQIGRARYMLKHGEHEKQEKIRAKCDSWKTLIRSTIDALKEKSELHNAYSFLVTLRKSMGATDQDLLKEKQTLKEYVQHLEGMYQQERYVELLQVLEIRKFSNPMLSVSLNDTEGMRVLKNTFGADALNKWDGNMLSMYASIDVEQQYIY